MSSAEALPHMGPFAENAGLVGGQPDNILESAGPATTGLDGDKGMFQGGSRRRRRGSRRRGSRRRGSRRGSKKGGRRRRRSCKH